MPPLVDFWNCTVPAIAGVIAALRSTLSLYCTKVGARVNVIVVPAFAIVNDRSTGVAAL